MNQLLLTLRFYATGSHLISAGDFSGVSKTSAHRIVHRVTIAIARLRPNYVKFPVIADAIKRKQIKFFNFARFPKVLGALDCTHIKIQSLGGNEAEIFRNRKGYFSMNVQAVCNKDLEFIDIVARWPGSAHDSTIFNNSRIRALFEAGTFGDRLLIGDSGYLLRSYIMTPLLNPRTRNEQLYNESLIRTRNTIERTFGVWKRRFPILALGTRFQKMDSIMAMIVATAVLHNICRKSGEPLPPDDPQVQLPVPWEQILEEGRMPEVHNGPNIRLQGNQVQQSLINGYFRMLLQ
ncbi:putative nuclease HARBI1 [Leptopilina heterotoma]|uniref:putative nuclease HARBI1 n=1 Tax=Leptopilina heterotoma TaxID=63436 RepID=UPI001CA9E7DB|nr:putative nuclease HARBI1 [Leptopilina heterotoma]XP_043462831.1 putative nuclease HARBI1 [Leptopilina heterotoma]